MRKRKAINITLSPDVREALDRYSEQSGRQPSHVIEEVLREMLRSHGWLNYDAPGLKKAVDTEDLYLQRVAEEPPTRKTKRPA